MKRILALSLSLIMILAMFAGCKSTGDNPKNPDVNAPKNARTDLILAVSADVTSPDPHKNNDTSSGRVTKMMFDTLIKMSKDGKSFEPMLAEKWEKISDTEYTFTLRQGVKFHNGEDFDAKDAKYSIERCMENPKASQATDSIKEVKILDDYKISITTKFAFAPFLFNMASDKVVMLDETTTAAAGDKFQDNPIGTGPMKYDSWTPNSFFKVVRNDDYWDGKPVATSITVRVIPEATSRTIALETGEVDFVDSVPPIDAERVKNNKDLKTVDQVQASVTYVAMSWVKKPFDDIRVRQAVAFAINRENIIEAVLEGYGEPLNTVLPPMMPGYDASLNMYPYDVDKSKALLADAGFADGLECEMSVSGDERNQIAQLIQSDLEKVGIKLDLVLLEWGAFLDYIDSGKQTMYILGWTNAYNPDGNFYDCFHKTRTNAVAGYKSEAVSAKIDASRKELDETKRLAMYKELQKEIMTDLPWIPLFIKTVIVGMDKNLQGVELEPITSYSYINAYVEE